jgi:hypothetical protein
LIQNRLLLLFYAPKFLLAFNRLHPACHKKFTGEETECVRGIASNHAALPKETAVASPDRDMTFQTLPGSHRRRVEY